MVLKGRAKWDIGCSNRFSCSQEQPLEERVKKYVHHLCYSVNPADCLPVPLSPEAAYQNVLKGLNTAYTLP